ncbi:MAG TPA: hypothetical protein VMR76_03705 [Candidatus Saccharimonadia bacterium]|nr:hypothetical protein [Candidatus Saccharimonadia bacterium]
MDEQNTDDKSPEQAPNTPYNQVTQPFQQDFNQQPSQQAVVGNPVSNPQQQPFKPKDYKKRSGVTSHKIRSLLILLGLVAILILAVKYFNKPAYKAPTNTPAENSQVHAWQSQYGTNLTTLKTNLNGAVSVVASLDYSALETTCKQLESEVTSDLNLPAIPLASAQANLSAGLKYLQQGSQLCISGAAIYLNKADNGSYSLTVQALNDVTTFDSNLQLGLTQINYAIAAIDK